MNQKQGTTMSLWEAIRERRSIGRVKQDPISTEQIEQLLEAASWAPSHYVTEPWRFFVMTGSGREVLGNAYADIAAASAQALGATPDELEALRPKNKSKAFRAPLVIAIAVSPSTVIDINRMEEFAAAHCAAQNMLLAAHAMGLGAIWRSGEPMYQPRMKQAFGLVESEELVGLIYVGYPDMQYPSGKRKPFSTKTIWMTEA